MLTHEQLLQAIPNALATVDLPNAGPKTSGKVRDIYRQGDTLILTGFINSPNKGHPRISVCRGLVGFVTSEI